jgi:hypothetical protein
LIDQHDGDAVTHWIHTAAGGTFETASFVFLREWFFAHRADKNVE